MVARGYGECGMENDCLTGVLFGADLSILGPDRGISYTMLSVNYLPLNCWLLRGSFYGT